MKVDLVGNVLKTQVRDTGIGMSQHGIRQLFQPFAKLDDPEHLNSQGCGLGLNICYGLVKALGGNGIQVQSVLGVGSTFEFSIPVVVVSHELSRKLTITRQISWIPNKLEDLHVLVVDDSTFNTMTVKMMLGAFDIRCTEAYSALQAISLLASDDSYALVLMDLEMPEMDGYEGLARLLEMEEEGEVSALPPIIACSANSADTERPKALSAGFTEYAEKPLSKSILLALLRAFSSTD